MRNLFNVLLMVLTLFVVACNNENKEPEQSITQTEKIFVDGHYKINKLKSTIEWANTNYSGTVELNDGEIKIKEGQIVSGKFVVDMNSIDVDLDNADDKNKLNNELKSDKFFNVARYSIVLFDFKNVEESSEESATHIISGKLIIMGVTNDITFPVTFSMEGESLLANASFSIDRTKWNVNVNHNSTTAEKDTPAEEVIKDEIEFKVNIVAKVLSDEVDFTQFD